MRKLLGVMVMALVFGAAACSSGKTTAGGVVTATAPPAVNVCKSLDQLRDTLNQVPVTATTVDTSLTQKLVQLNNEVQIAAVKFQSSGDTSAATALRTTGTDTSTLLAQLASGKDQTQAVLQVQSAVTKAIAVTSNCT